MEDPVFGRDPAWRFRLRTVPVQRPKDAAGAERA